MLEDTAFTPVAMMVSASEDDTGDVLGFSAPCTFSPGRNFDHLAARNSRPCCAPKIRQQAADALRALLPLPLEIETEEDEFWVNGDRTYGYNYCAGNMAGNGKATRDEIDILSTRRIRMEARSHYDTSQPASSACQMKATSPSDISSSRVDP